jgi:hypothetical protein
MERLEDRCVLAVDLLNMASASPREASGHNHSHGPEINDYLPPSQHLFNSNDYLTEAAAGAPLDLALDYLTYHAGDLGLKADDLTGYTVTSQYTSEHNGVTHIYLQQSIQGLDVLGAYINVNLSAAGEIINVGSSFISSDAASKSWAFPSAALSASDALRSLAYDFGWSLDVTPSAASSSFPGDFSYSTILDARGVSLEDIPAELVFVPLEGGGMELAWNLLVQTTDGQHAYNAAVSADDGELLHLNDWISADSYRVYDAPFESPNDGPRTLVVNPAESSASPFNWHDTNGIAGAEFTTTRGNNVHAYADRNNDNIVDAGSDPNGTAALIFDFPIDLGQAPVNYRDAAVTNLFYWNNWIHDVHYQYGFNEASGNFQVNNYGEGGLGNDDVRAEAQDGADVGNANNANMFTPPDGQRPRMQMYEFTLTSPRRDGDLDNGIIVHEYGHGVSNRLTGGPANANALDAIQSGGMGEGWSDWWAMMFTQVASDTKMAAYPMGTYALGQPSNGPGIRRFPYSFDMSINPLTYGNFNVSNEVHDSGEIWCSALWDLNWLLIDQYGFDPDFYNGTGGNNLALQLIMDGLKLQPSNPSFLDGRDAILLADQILTGGDNNMAIWTAFARRGMGFSAFDGGSGNATTVIEAFDLPATSEGFIAFDAEDYEVGETVTITVGDIDLTGGGPINVQVVSTSGDTETVTLTETAVLGIFEGSIATAGLPATPGNGVLNVAALNLISVSYNDADDGSGAPAVVSDTANITEIVVIFSESFDVNPGWTTQGEWAFGQPAGLGGTSFGGPDPTSGATGLNVYGVDLNGDYDLTVGGPWYLTTSAIDASGYENVTLNFQRWLNTDYPPYVYQTIDVSNNGSSWVNVYTNPGGQVVDTEWQDMEYDISAVADDQPTVYIRWGYRVNGAAYPYSGWNIDDVNLRGTLIGPDLLGPRVVADEPTIPIGAGHTSVVFHFNEFMDQTSFAVADDVVSFTGPGGSDLLSTVTGYTWLDGNSLQVNFDPVLVVGNYSMTIGPNITDDAPSLNPMDQNINGTNGEVGIDVYTVTFEVGSQDYGDAAQGSGAPLPTTLAGGNGQNGNMFNITALNTVTITSFDGHPQVSGNWSIYYRPGTHVGFETNAGAWTFLGSAAGVTAQPFGTATPIPISLDVTIPAGETYSFYVTMTGSGNVNYTNGTGPVGAVYTSDDNIQFRQGTGNAALFSSVFSPRIFNGVIHYETAGGYPTTLDADGARHLPLGPQLGANRDTEPDGQPTTDADGDDTNGSPDDEDGISFFVGTLFTTTTEANPTATVRIDVQNPDPISNRLDAWIDFNQDGVWSVDEQIFTDYELGNFAGVRQLQFTIPQDTGGNVEIGETFARFRLSTAGGLLPTGSAPDGEVEDYQVIILDTPGPGTISGLKWHDLDGNGSQDVGEPGLEGWTIFLDLNGDGQRVTSMSVEPDNYDLGMMLNTIQPGITLSAIGTAVNEVYAGTPSGGYASTGALAFTRNGPFGWGGTIRLRADFAASVHTVSLDAISDDALDVGVLEAYDASGNLLATYTTAGLAAGAIETMTISRTAPDIAYIIASGGAGDVINLDNLQTAYFDPSTTTDANGNYAFHGLSAGEYFVIEEVPEDWEQTYPGSGGTENGHPVLLGPGQEVYEINFGNWLKRGSIQGQKWHDLSNDGVKDVGEPGLSGWTIYIDANLNDALDFDEFYTFTDDDGNYGFFGLEPGDYILKEVQQEGWSQTFAPPLTTVLPGANVTGVDFGNWPELGSIHGQKFHDLDGDGEKDVNDPGLEGWTIFIDANDNGLFDVGEVSTTTDVDGNYSFENLPFGQYVLGEVQQAGWEQTAPSASSIDALLTGLDLNNAAISAQVPTRYDFFEGATGNSIIDGGNDMYDGGNYLNTNLWSSIFYTNRVVTPSDSQFGPGSHYFTAKYNGLFVMAATDISINSFTITGNVGADGGGSVDGAVLSTTVDGRPYTIFVKRIFNAFDPSVNHIIIVPGNGAGVTHSFATNTDDDFHTVNGLGTVDELYYLLVARANGAFLANSSVLNVANTFLGNIVPHRVHRIDVAPGEDVTDVDFGNRLPPGSISGQKWHDLDRDGTKDAGEPGLPGWTIYIDENTNGAFDPGERSTTTDANGNYLFDNVGTAEYVVAEVLQTGWDQTFAPPPVTVLSGVESTGVDFGNWPQPVSIHGQKWNDLDGDGAKDAGEPGLAGWTIFLDQNQNGVLDLNSTTVEPDNYAVGTVLDNVAPGATLTTTGGGNVYAAVPFGGYASTGSLAFAPTAEEGGWGGLGLRVNFLSPIEFVSIDAISDDAFDLGQLQAFDADGNLLQTYTTAGLGLGAVESMKIDRLVPEIAYVIANGASGQVINLDNLQFGAGGERRTFTDGDGNYHFTDLDAGIYTVAEVQQAGWTQTAPAGLTGLIVNGGFETGNFSGWTRVNTSGSFIINNGATIPSSGDGPFAPYEGAYSAVSDQTGPGTRNLYQDVTLPAGSVPVLRWTDMLRNHAGVFVDPTQEYRVEIRNLSNQVLATVFSTNPGDPTFQDWTERSADLSAFAGQTVRIAFVEQDSIFFFNAHVDNVRITSTGVVGTHHVELDPGEVANDRDFGNHNLQSLAGDYNSDATADAADYVVWRKFLGNSAVASPTPNHSPGGDGNGDGQIGPDDYNVWHQHFGETLTALGGGSPPIGIAPTPDEPLAVDEATNGFLAAQVAEVGRASASASLSFVESTQTVDVQAPIENQRASATSTTANLDFAAIASPRLAHHGSTVRSALRESAAAFADQLDAALLARFATPAAKQTPSDWRDRDWLESEEANFGDEMDLDCVDEVFALLATG